jgi:ATP-dependent helicase/nuclease subunit B
MEQRLARALQEGYTLATANPRLARRLQLAWGAAQQAAGRQSWAAAPITTLEAWLASARTDTGGERLLLTPAQEQRLWEDIVAADDPTPLSPGAAARAAATAWERVQAWDLDLRDTAWDETHDTETFRRWAQHFAQRCRDAAYITPAELPAAVAAAIARGALPAPRVLLLGFDRLTPQHEALCAAVRAAGGAMEEYAPETVIPVRARRVEARDAEQELALAAAWTRGLLDAGAAGRIGVVVAGLAQRRAAAERAFLDALHPGRAPGDTRPTAFHISIGPPLAEHPVAGSALLTLAAWIEAPPIPAGEALRWLPSPLLRGAEGEGQRRAAWTRQRRCEERAWWAWEELEARARMESCAGLAGLLADCRGARNAWPEHQGHGGWAASLAALLAAAGWPGERGLTSAEHQAARAWAETVDEFRRLDQVSPSAMNAREALRRLRELAETRIFQPQAAPAPVEVLGWLEAAGERFEHLWVAGMDDATLPPPAAPHPFLPLHWQRSHAMPGASAEVAAAFAQRVWQRLRGSAPDLTASWPANDGDLKLRPSPLLALLSQEREELEARAAAPAPAEEIDDRQGPPPAAAHGGSALFADQAACPFRAFAHARLGAKAPPPPPAGLAATTRGALLHKTLKAFWGEVSDRTRLQAMPEGEREAAARRAAEAAVRSEPRLRPQPALAELEIERLTRTLLAWLPQEEEAKRPPFRVHEREHEFAADIGGIELHLKIDRLDELDGGALRVVDYKSGEVTANDWAPPRMNAPQLPLYAATHPEHARITQVAFAQLKPGKMRWVESGVKPEWHAGLEALAADYGAGAAAVDPKQPDKTCEHCDLPMLCRVGDRAPELANNDAGGDDHGE